MITTPLCRSQWVERIGSLSIRIGIPLLINFIFLRLVNIIRWDKWDGVECSPSGVGGDPTDHCSSSSAVNFIRILVFTWLYRWVMLTTFLWYLLLSSTFCQRDHVASRRSEKLPQWCFAWSNSKPSRLQMKDSLFVTQFCFSFAYDNGSRSK